MIHRFPNAMKAAEAFVDQHPDISGFAANAAERDGHVRLRLTFVFAGVTSLNLVITADDEARPSLLVHTFNRLAEHVDQNPSLRRPAWLRPAKEPAFT